MFLEESKCILKGNGISPKIEKLIEMLEKDESFDCVIVNTIEKEEDSNSRTFISNRRRKHIKGLAIDVDYCTKHDRTKLIKFLLNYPEKLKIIVFKDNKLHIEVVDYGFEAILSFSLSTVENEID